jgi:hypothetical protein
MSGDIFRLVYFGRVRSGKRWFWAAVEVLGKEMECWGWADSEDIAIAAARGAAVEIATSDMIRTHASLRNEVARDKLKELNKAKRAARPAPKTKGSAQVEYLYGLSLNGNPIRFQITKKTRQRIYYSRGGEWLNADGTLSGQRVPDERTGFVDRIEFEANGTITNRGRTWQPDWPLFASFEHVRARPKPQPKPGLSAAKRGELADLKEAMANAHPDRGGSSERFIQARKRYMAARMAGGGK